jgi:hypothetical protein
MSATVARVRKEEQHAVSAESRFLALFWELADYNDVVRLSAAYSIVTAVDQCEANRNNPHGDAVCGYTVNRLMQGMCSSNKKARQGFATALTLLIAKRREIGEELVEYTWKILDRKDLSKQEVKDELIGRLFLVLVLCQSGVVAEMKFEKLKVVVDAVLDIVGKDKNWIMQLAFEALAGIIEAINGKENFVAVLNYFEEKNVFEKLEISCDVLSLAFSVYLKSEEFHLESKFKEIFENSANYESKISKQLLRSSDLDMDGTIHLLWEKILKWFFGSGKSENFAVFWNVVVEVNLFSHSPSVKRKSLGLALVEMALFLLKNETDLGVILSSHVCDLLVSFASSKKSSLHSNAIRCLESIVAKVQQVPSLALIAINRLNSSCRGATGASFDKKTRTNTIKSLLACVDVNGLAELVNSLLQKFTDNADHEKEQIAVIDQLYSVLSNQFIQSDFEKKKKILLFFMGVAYLGEAASIPVASSKVSNFASERFLSVVSASVNGPKNSLDISFLEKVNEWFDSTIAELDYFSQDLKEARAESKNCLKKISKHKHLSSDQKEALHLLLEYVLLMQMWSEEDASEGTDILKELYARIRNLKSPSLEEFTTGIVDIVLSVLIKPYSFFREMAKQVFRAFIGSVNQYIVNDLSRILITKKDDDEDSESSDVDEEEEDHSSSEASSDDQELEDEAADSSSSNEENQIEDDLEVSAQDLDSIDMEDYTSKLEAVFRERFNAKRLQKGKSL